MGFFLTHRIEAQTFFGENFGAFYVRKFVAQKNSFVQNSLCRRATLINSRGPLRSSTWNEYYTNECQSRDSNRSATNAGAVRTHFCVLGEIYDRQRTLSVAIRIAAITLASDSAMTIARFRPSKHESFKR